MEQTMVGLIVAAAITLMSPITEPQKSRDKVTIYDACWSVTNYWPFDEHGHLQAWNGQADGSPEFTANMTPVTLDREWTMAAGPLPLVGKTLIMPDGTRLAVTDTFGHPVYQAGVFWHDHYEEWVIGVDIFTPDPLHYLECRGEVR